jgi:benzoyl-CoA reductase subunit BamC
MKRIKIDSTKCSACHMCETACVLQHTAGDINPERARIRILQVDNINLPVIAGPYTEAECTAKGILVIEGKEYDQCLFCRFSCPVRPIFKELDDDSPLTCDFCGEPPDPQCVRWCNDEALTQVEE